MRSFILRRFSLSFLLLVLFSLALGVAVSAQSKTQKSDKSNTNQKKNERPTLTEEERKKQEEQRKQEEEAKNAVVDNSEPLKIKTNIVNVDAVVINKKSKEIITGLKRENFGVFENGVKQDIAIFSTPEAPITVTLVLEYSRWAEIFGVYGSRGWERGILEVIRPAAYFLTNFVKPPEDYASVIAFDMRPTPITDFTNDRDRIRDTVDLLLRNNPVYRESNLYDAVQFALVGGKTDPVVLERSKEKLVEYGGMVDIKAKRRAIILVATGIDTMSKTNYDAVRRTIQNSGIPIYVISTGNLFYKMYETQLPAMDGIDGTPGRMTFQMAQLVMKTFASESGGMHFPITFPGETASVLQAINALLRNQYSIAYDAGEKPRDGKKYKLEVKVDINGDGVYEEKLFDVQHRPFYTVPKDEKGK